MLVGVVVGMVATAIFHLTVREEPTNQKARLASPTDTDQVKTLSFILYFSAQFNYHLKILTLKGCKYDITDSTNDLRDNALIQHWITKKTYMRLRLPKIHKMSENYPT
jgi:hypothetical protein